MIRFAIIGTGNIADQHALGVTGCKKAELVAVCDMNQARAKEFAAKYNITKIYADSNDLLADPDVDAVCICTPSGTYGPLSIAAAKAGKHILCEKPIEIKAEKSMPLWKPSRPTRSRCSASTSPASIPLPSWQKRLWKAANSARY